IYGISYTHLMRWREGQIEVLSPRAKMYLLDFHVDASEVIWVVGTKGLFQFIPESKTFERPFYNLPKDLMNRTIFITNVFGQTWVQCYNGHLYTLGDSTCSLVKGPDGKPIAITKPSKDEQGNYYCGIKSEGLGKVFKITQQGEKLHWETLAYDDESVQSAFFGFQVAGERFLLSSRNHIFLDSLSHLKPQFANVRLHLTHLLVNRKPVSWERHQKLVHDENSLNLAFNGISYRLLPLEYRFRLLGLDSAWQYTNNHEAQYTNLFPGDYQFEVQARHEDGPWSPAVACGFSIAPPYWETWWFRSCAVVVGLVLLYLLFQWRLRQLRVRDQHKAQIALEMSRLEMTALKAQLNPHFIFNAMGSLSYYLTNNQPQKAEEYLQRFAQLIRGVLDNSEESSVPLSTELDLMRHYVVLEAERFVGGGIDFEISVEGFDPTQVKVPPALFQPYLENAIWHGLQPKTGARRLQLSCERENQQVKFTIEDNGIGRAASAERSSTNRKKRSYGMMIASRRIETWNQQQTHQLAIEDLHNSDGSAAGTRVVFFLPLVMGTEADQPFSKRYAS
ncbi:MAG: histidine kinase, partial [Salibacteraceae bacterium]